MPTTDDSESRLWLQESSGSHYNNYYSEMYAILESGIDLSLLFLYILVHARKMLSRDM